MSLQCGIVGLPNVGKSTLFNTLTKSSSADAANFPFCTIDPNVGVINVPDARLDRLAELVNPQKILNTVVEIVDIAGLVKGASKGEGKGNAFLSDIRNVDAIIHVIRCFEDDNVIHVDGSIDPVRDKEVIDFELQMKDLEQVEKRIERFQKMAKGNDKSAIKGIEVLTVVKEHLMTGQPARTAEVSEDNWHYINELQLLSAKPVLYVCNVDEAAAKDGNAFVEKVREAAASEEAEVIHLSVKIESEIAQLETDEDQEMFLEDLGLDEPGMNRLIRSAYQLLDLITYFTAGEKEVRAWTIRTGTKAPGAAGVIHTDFERGFIKAEVIGFDDYDQLESEAKCREAGKLRMEGKEYVVKDGDVMHFKFNV